ncbi:MAG: hypothetical protein CMO55_08845 [Verrucomicrobiales bacterium]|nr:hypothetical protein [Verrucomicrobiales bacterium]
MEPRKHHPSSSRTDRASGSRAACTIWLALASLLPVSSLLTSCATGYYAENGARGGHEYRRVDTNTFQVTFNGNAVTSSKRAKDFALLRAADLCLEHDFESFIIQQQVSHVDTQTYQTGSYSTTNASYYGNANGGTLYGTTTTTPKTRTVSKPSAGIEIYCFNGDPPPHSGKTYQAAEVREQIRAEYEMEEKPNGKTKAKLKPNELLQYL